MRLRLIIVIAALTIFSSSAFAQGAKTYTSKSPAFSVQYPSNFKFLTGARAKAETAFGDPGRGKKHIAFQPVSIARKYHGWYEFNVWTSNDGADKCGAPVAGSEDEIALEVPEEGVKMREIAGHRMYRYVAADGGMSKQLGLEGYRGVVNGRCWQIQSLIYQVSAYDDFKSFDQKPIDRAFEKFVKSFKFN